MIFVVLASLSQCSPTGTSRTAKPANTAEASGERVTASGLRYIDIEIGRGTGPAPGEVVTVHYTGWLEDGTKFDSSHDSGRPIEFTIGKGQVIAGWDEGVISMKVGGRRKLIVPPVLAYGRRGYPGVIGPNATLVFEVELLRIRQ